MYCIYLRKSRADAEAEARGEGETLARHEKALLELAKKLRLNISEIYREIVSGETIAARPVMQQLLSEVEQGVWNGVLVMEVERLARGDTIDQGIVAQTFKYSSTKIITPVKTYNPGNEFDEEYFEFGLFMSRREYKTINRRLQNGRLASVKEGKYVANKPPYGYERIRIKGDKGFTLAIVPEEAEIIKTIFEWYTIGEKQPDSSFKRLGTSLIARRLNNMCVPAKSGGDWSVATIRDILINPVYTGKIRWNWRRSVKKMVDGQVEISRPRSNDCVIYPGLHPAIIPDEVFNAAQELIKKNPPRPIQEHNTVKNPLSGLVVCGKCGRKMVRRPYTGKVQPDTLICPLPSCKNVSSRLDIVEARILQALSDWLIDYKFSLNLKEAEAKKYSDKLLSQTELQRKAISKLRAELTRLNSQLDRSYDLLEQGVYDSETFLRRSRSLTEQIERTKANISALEEVLNVGLMREEAAVNIIPKVERLLSVYRRLSDPKDKNDMLKEVLEKVVYSKEKGTRWQGSPDDFAITLYPKIPSPSPTPDS